MLNEYLYSLIQQYHQECEDALKRKDIYLLLFIRQQLANLFPVVIDYAKERKDWTEEFSRVTSLICVLDPMNSVPFLKDALRYNPKDLELLNNLGFILYKYHQQYDDAIEYYEQCLSHDPTYTLAYSGLIHIYRMLNFHSLELKCAQRGVSKCPEEPEMWNALGLAVESLMGPDSANKALEYFRTGLSICKKSKGKFSKCESKLYLNIGYIYGNQGDIIKAIEMYLRAIRSDNTHLVAYQNILLNLHYLDKRCYGDHTYNRIYSLLNVDSSLQQLKEGEEKSTIHRQFCELLYPQQHKQQEQEQHNIATFEEKIRIGYISSDLVDHAVSFFANVLFAKPNSIFDVFVYSNAVIKVGEFNFDKVTTRCIAGLDTNIVYNIIKQDNLDILIDLSGHTSGSRLDVIAKRPATLILSYLGYPGNIGFPWIKRISDKYTEQFSNKDSVVTMDRLFLCYTPKHSWMTIPHKIHCVVGNATKKAVTFGCFGKLQKINEKVIAVWRDLLTKVPNSRLVIKGRHFKDDIFAKNYKSKHFKGYEDRVLLLKPTKTTEEHLATFKLMDICLDTFPYSGTTITTEALFMNVPVVTLVGKEHVERVSGSILSSMGLHQCIATTIDDYIQKAINLIEELPSLNVREKFLTGPICNDNDFMKHYERLLIDCHRGGV